MPGLTLSRRTGEEVIIRTPDGQEIVVTVVDLQRGRMRLQIEAPPDVVILRGETIQEREDRR